MEIRVRGKTVFGAYKVMRVSTGLICLLLVGCASTSLDFNSSEGGLRRNSIDTTETYQPQYLVLRKHNTCVLSDCRLGECTGHEDPTCMNGADAGQVSDEAFDDIINTFRDANTNPRRKLALGVILSHMYHALGDSSLDGPASNPCQGAVGMRGFLCALLDKAQVRQLPVFVALDGYQWLIDRWDVWGDAADPTQRERWCPDASGACTVPVTGGWRNWGQEVRLNFPPINIANKNYRDLVHRSQARLAKIISHWYHRKLGPSEKYLLAGVSPSVELDVNYNNYFYVDGKSSAEGRKATVPLGFAAVEGYGVKDASVPPDQLTDLELARAVQKHSVELTDNLLALGIPRHKIFTHAGVRARQLDPSDNFAAPLIFPAALSRSAQPGWSQYQDLAKHGPSPDAFDGLTPEQQNVFDTGFGVPEWWAELPGGHTASSTDWAEMILRTLHQSNARLLAIANWETHVRPKPEAIEGVKKVLQRDVTETCASFFRPVVDVDSVQEGASYGLHVRVDPMADRTYLQITKKLDFDFAGNFNNPSEWVVNHIIEKGASPDLSGTLPHGTYFVKAACDRMCPNGRVTRMHSDVIPLNVNTLRNGSPIFLPIAPK